LLAADRVVTRFECFRCAIRHDIRVECAAEQAFESLSDELANCLGSQTCESKLCAREIHGVSQRGVRVDQRPIQIEKYGAITQLGGHRPAILSLRQNVDARDSCMNTNAPSLVLVSFKTT